jgi:hypothetical protein
MIYHVEIKRKSEATSASHKDSLEELIGKTRKSFVYSLDHLKPKQTTTCQFPHESTTT